MTVSSSLAGYTVRHISRTKAEMIMRAAKRPRRGPQRLLDYRETTQVNLQLCPVAVSGTVLRRNQLAGVSLAMAAKSRWSGY